MMRCLGLFYFKSQLLGQDEFAAMCRTGQVIEQDERGIKVLRFQNGDYLKIFRPRRRFSGTQLFSHARRFCRNAARLQALQIPTVRIQKLYHFEGNSHTAVLYSPLEGETLRGVVHKGNYDACAIARKLGEFLAALHAKGVHFHSLHTGNVVLTPQGEFGLIDISDMSIYPWSLFCNTRIRSFKRLCRYKEDILLLGKPFWQEMLNHYFLASGIREQCKLSITDASYRDIPFPDMR